MRSARLLAILLLLQARGHLTARELSRALGVDKRTIARDLSALDALGLPVRSVRGPGGGYELSAGILLDMRQFISEDSAPVSRPTAAAPAGRRGLEDDVQTAQIELLRVGLMKLEDALPPEYRRDLEHARSQLLHQSPHAEVSGQPRHLATIRAALWRGCQLRVRYPDADDNSASRWHVLDPCALLTRHGVWYVIGYHPEREDMRALAVARIEAAELIDEPVTGSNAIDLEFSWGGASERATPAARSVLVHLLLEEHGMGAVRAEGFLRGEPRPSGDTGWLVTLEFPQATQAVHYVLRLGAWARVLAPAEVRTRVVEHVRALSQVYGIATGG